MNRSNSVSKWDLRKWLVTLIAAASLVGIFLATQRGPLAGTGDDLWPLSWMAWPVAGWIVLVSRPGNRIGRLCLGIGATMGLAFGLQSVVLDVGPASAAWIELAYTVLGVLPFLLIVAVLNTFPSGTYAGRVEAIVGRALIVVGSWALLGFLISPEPLSDTGLGNPLATPAFSGLAVITNDSGFLLVVVLALAALTRLVIRGRRSTGVERLQFRWLTLGGAVFVLIGGAAQFLPDDSPARFVWLLGGCSIPTSVGVAVVKYRLYEIDRIISRSIGYVLVVGTSALVWVAAITLLTTVLPAGSSLAVAASTLSVATLFNPLRRRVQERVDRRFNRSRYDGQHELDRVSELMRHEINPESVIEHWVGTVAGTMQPTSIAVWVRGER